MGAKATPLAHAQMLSFMFALTTKLRDHAKAELYLTELVSWCAFSVRDSKKFAV